MELKIRLKAVDDGFSGSVVLAGKHVQALSGSADGANKSLGNIETTVTRLKDKMAQMGHAAVGLFVAGQFAGVAGDLIRLADGFNVVTAKMQYASRQFSDFARTQQQLYEMAQRAGARYADVGEIYTSVARGAEALGLSQQRVIGITQALANAVRAVGGSSQATSAALMQFSQSIASGQLRGDELRSVLEQFPPLATAIAQGLGVATGELFHLGETGKLSIADVLAAIEKMAPALQEQADKMPATFSAGATRVVNAAQAMMAELDKQFGASQGFNSLVDGMVSGIDTVRRHADELAGLLHSLLTGTVLVAGGYAIGASIAFIGTSAATAAALVAALNTELLFMAGAVASRLYAKFASLGLAARGGLVGLALWGGLELGEILEEPVNRLIDAVPGMRSAVEQALEPFNRFFYHFGENIGASIIDGMAVAANLIPGLGPLFAQRLSALAESLRGQAVAEARETARAAAEAAKQEAARAARYITATAPAIPAILKGGAIKDTVGGYDPRGQAESHKAAADAAKKHADELRRLAEEHEKAYAAMMGSITSHHQALLQEEAMSGKLTAGQKTALGIMEQVRDGKIKLTETEAEALATALESMLADEKRIDTAKELAEQVKAQAEAEKEHPDILEKSRQLSLDQLDATIEATIGIEERTRALRYETEEMGLTGDALKKIKRARIDEKIALLEASKALLAEDDLRASNIAAIDAQIAALNGLADAEAQNVDKRAMLDALKEQKDLWKDIEKTAHDTFVSIMDGGKNAWQRLKESAKNIFFDWLYQTTLKKWIINIGATITGTGLAGVASAADGGSGGGIGLPYGSILQGVGGFIGGGFGSGLSFAGSAGMLEGFTSGISTLFSGGLGGEGILSSLGAMAPGIGLALGAISLLGGGLGSLFGGHVRLPPAHGQSL